MRVTNLEGSGHPREIQEVRNAFAAYETMEDWDASSEEDLLAAHELLMRGLVDETGRYRSGGVGIFQSEQLVHMATPADRVPKLMAELLDWLATTREHPLVASCVFHYEFEFIHPFADGNGRVGRLWQTLILRNWKPLLAYLPAETVIRERQEDCYRVPAVATTPCLRVEKGGLRQIHDRACDNPAIEYQADRDIQMHSDPEFTWFLSATRGRRIRKGGSNRSGRILAVFFSDWLRIPNALNELEPPRRPWPPG